MAIPGPYSDLPMRKGLERKAHRKRMGASEDLERKARFFCPRRRVKKCAINFGPVIIVLEYLRELPDIILMEVVGLKDIVKK
ncbi:MAG: hypothetical protein LBK13_13905, partial [Spirochaetales bacterium]|nr:hypothetical protein [Spirochaetales bacterium]